MKKRLSILGLAIFLATFADRAGAQVPTIADLPANLPAQARSKLLMRRSNLVTERDTLKADIKMHDVQCKDVVEDTPLDKSCQTEQVDLESRKATYISKVKQFNADVKVSSTEPLANIDAQIQAVENQIRAIGFDRRASEFEAWAKLSTNAKKQFEEQARLSCWDLLFTGALDADKTLMKSIGSATPFSSQKLIGILNKLHLRDPLLWERIGEVGATTGKPGNAKAAREMIELLGKSADVAWATQEFKTALYNLVLEGGEISRSDIESATEATTTLLGMGLKGPLTGFFVSECQFTSAALYNNVARRVSSAEVEHLSSLTAGQLKELNTLSKRLEDLVQKRIAVKNASQAH